MGLNYLTRQGSCDLACETAYQLDYLYLYGR
jgi:hypothetical protein